MFVFFLFSCIKEKMMFVKVAYLGFGGFDLGSRIACFLTCANERAWRGMEDYGMERN